MSKYNNNGLIFLRVLVPAYWVVVDKRSLYGCCCVVVEPSSDCISPVTSLQYICVTNQPTNKQPTISTTWTQEH